jgi:hypothetical protein
MTLHPPRTCQEPPLICLHVLKFGNSERVIRSCDALWLNQQYGVWKGITKQNVANIDDDDADEPFIDISVEDSQYIEAGREPETDVDRIEIDDQDKKNNSP